MNEQLKHFALVTGIICVLIGVSQFIFGSWSTSGVELADVNSQERFAGGVFIGYGLAWIWTSRLSPMPVKVLQFLAGVLLLAALGRVISMILHGWPSWIQSAQTGIEIVISLVVFLLTALAQADRDRIHPADSTRAT